MDRIGTIMGFVTIPMAALSLLGALAGLWLLGTGAGVVVGVGAAAFAAGLALAWAVDQIIERAEAAALATRRAAGAAAGQVAALLCGAAPMAVLLGWEYDVMVRLVPAEGPLAPRVAAWLWSYAIATGPWTAHAMLVGSDRRTLCGIRAYAGHLGYWLFSLAMLAGAPPAVAMLALALPAVLPVTVGTLLAVADREALRNVRI